MTDRDPDQRRLAALYHDLFELDARGRAVYEDLYRRFVSRARVHTDGGIDAVLKTYKDAARREVVEYIVRMINRHNGITDSQPQGESDEDSRAL